MSRRAVAGQTEARIMAQEFNNWQNVSDAYNSGGLGSPPGGGLSGNLQPGLVRVKNNTATDYPSMSILGIDDVLIKPANALANFKTNQQTVLVCNEIDPQKHVNKWVCLRDPIAAGNIGWAYVGGIFPGYVQFTPISEWDSGTQYDVGDCVYIGSDTWLCLYSNLNKTPVAGDSIYWADTNNYRLFKTASIDTRSDAEVPASGRETQFLSGGGDCQIIHAGTDNILTSRKELCLLRSMPQVSDYYITEKISTTQAKVKPVAQYVNDAETVVKYYPCGVERIIFWAGSL